MKRDIKTILKENNNNKPLIDLSLYWDYRDSLGDKQIFSIITEEEGLSKIENEIFENSIDYINEVEQEWFKENLNEEELEDDNLKEDLRNYFNWDYDLNGLLRYSEIRLRLEFNTNEDLLYYEDLQKGTNETMKLFKKRFKGAIDEKEIKTEIDNLCNDYANLVAYFKVGGEEILKLREEYQKGYITLRKGINFGLFNSWMGGGSLLECEFKKDVKIFLEDWRYKRKSTIDKKNILKGLDGKKESSYYDVSLWGDKLTGYGIDEVYGLSSEGWKEW